MIHDWHIESDQIARHEARRGRRHAFETLDPKATALVVVDMVPFFVLENPFARGIVPIIESLASAVRAAGGTVAWTVPAEESPAPARVEFFGESIAQRYAASGGTGPLRERVWHEFELGARDVVVTKSAPSAFFPGRCDLPPLLDERGIDTVVVAGTVANVCCEATVRDASTLGYRVVMVADANAATRDEDLNASLRTVYRSFGDVRPANEVIALVADR